MSENRPRILLIGGTYRALCVLERLLERGDHVVAFVGLEGTSSERDFCPEILEICDRSSIPARSGHKLGEEIIRWLEDRIRPELSIAVGVNTALPLAIGGNCRHGLIEVIDSFSSESCNGVVLRQRGQVVLERELPRPDEDEGAGDAYLRMLDEVLRSLEEYLDRLAPPVADGPLRVPYCPAPIEASRLTMLASEPDPGPETDALEREVREYVGAESVFALSSCVEAHRLLLAALEIGKGDQVIAPGIVSASAAEAIRESGARGIFADVRPDRLTVSPERVAAALDASTRALIVAHPLGQPAELDELYAIAQENDIELIEDAGDSLGARFGDSRLGRSPSSCVFRFPLGATLPGCEVALVTLPSLLAERYAPLVKELRLGNGLARHVRCELAGLDDRIALRRANASEYSSEFSRYDAFRIPVTPQDALPTYSGYLLRVTRFARTCADDLSKLLAEGHIETRRLLVPLRERDLAALPGTDNARANGLLLPVDGTLSNQQKDRLLDAIFGYAIG